MTLFEYNCRNIIVIVLTICALCFIIYKIINKFSKLNCSDSVIKTVIIGIAVIVCIILSFFSWETNTQFQKGTVTECIRMGSIGDFIVNYTFYIVDAQGNEMVYNTPISSSKKYINKLENISCDDQILIKYGEKLHYAFDVEIV